MPSVTTEPVFVYEGTELEALFSANNYYRWLVTLAAPYLGTRVLEIGAGLGTAAAALLAKAPDISLTLVEPAVNNVPVLRERFSGDQRVRVLPGYIESVSSDLRDMDAVVLFNVLEHADDAAALLAAARETLHPDGRLVILVPAHPGLFGSLDRAFGHLCRFTRPGLRTTLERAGYRVVDIRFINSLGVIPWFVLSRVLRHETLGAGAVRLYDVLAIPVLSRLERWLRLPFGQSLFAVAERAN